MNTRVNKIHIILLLLHNEYSLLNCLDWQQEIVKTTLCKLCLQLKQMQLPKMQYQYNSIPTKQKPTK